MVDFKKMREQEQLKRKVKLDIIDLICDINEGKFNKDTPEKELENVIKRINEIVNKLDMKGV
jgi:hypothetical protein